MCAAFVAYSWRQTLNNSFLYLYTPFAHISAKHTPMSRWAWLLVVFCVTAWVSRTPYAEAADANYTVNGPCKYQKIAIGTQKMPFSSTGCKLKECIVKVYVTLPTKAGQSPECQQGPNPVIVFFNAFQVLPITACSTTMRDKLHKHHITSVTRCHQQRVSGWHTSHLCSSGLSSVTAKYISGLFCSTLYFAHTLVSPLLPP